MKIIVLDGYTLNPGDLSWERLKEMGECIVYDRTTKEQIVERIGDADIVFTNKTPLTKDIFAKCPSVKYVGVLATGYNIVDVQAAKEAGIIVTNIPTYGTHAVAQYVFALLLEICHHVAAHDQAVKAGDWENCKDFCFWNFPMMELHGKTMGIIGLGKIGQATAKLATAFGMKVLAAGSTPNKALENENPQYVELDELYAKSDVISLHCPLFDSTKGMINKNSISKMKDGIIIVNTSRGPLIVEEDLAQALASGKVFGAAVDVVSTEPIHSNNPLLAAKNCIITPHIAWAPIEARARLLDIAIDGLQAYLKGNPINVVNK